MRYFLVGTRKYHMPLQHKKRLNIIKFFVGLKAQPTSFYPLPLRERVKFLNERSEFRNSGEGGELSELRGLGCVGGHSGGKAQKNPAFLPSPLAGEGSLVGRIY